MRRRRNKIVGGCVDEAMWSADLDNDVLAGHGADDAGAALVAAFCADLRANLGGASLDRARLPRWQQRTSRLHTLLTGTAGKVGVGIAAAFLGFGGVATAGALPASLQHRVATAADHVGLGFVPDPQDARSPSSRPPAGTPTSGHQTATASTSGPPRTTSRRDAKNPAGTPTGDGTHSSDGHNHDRTTTDTAGDGSNEPTQPPVASEPPPGSSGDGQHGGSDTPTTDTGSGDTGSGDRPDTSPTTSDSGGQDHDGNGGHDQNKDSHDQPGDTSTTSPDTTH